MASDLRASNCSGADTRPQRSWTKTLLPWLVVAVWIGLLVGGSSLVGKLEPANRDGQTDDLSASAEPTEALLPEAALPAGADDDVLAVDAGAVHLREWAARHEWTESPLLFVEWAMGDDGLRVATVLLAAGLLLRRRIREAVLVVAVMYATRELATIGKAVVDRDRPAWQNPDHLLQSGSFPSAHAATVAAFAGLVIAVSVLGGAGAVARRRAVVAAVLAMGVVCADRLLLGRHYPTDLIGGAALGGAMVLVGVALVGRRPRLRATIRNAEERRPSGTALLTTSSARGGRGRRRAEGMKRRGSPRCQ